MAGTRTIGSKLILKKDGSETEDTVIANLTSIGQIGLESEEIDTTTLDTEGDFKEFMAGTKDAGSFDIAGNITNDVTLSVFLALANSRDLREWEVVSPRGAKWELKAYVSAFHDGERTVDGLETFSASLRVSGAPEYTSAP